MPNLFQEIYLIINPKKIAFMKFILEGYDGLAFLSTMDREKGLVRLLVSGARYFELLYLLNDLAPKCRHPEIFVHQVQSDEFH